MHLMPSTTFRRLVVLATFLFSSLVAAQSLEDLVDYKGLNKNEKEIAISYIGDVQKMLPSTLLSKVLRSRAKIRFSSLNKNSLKKPNCSLVQEGEKSAAGSILGEYNSFFRVLTLEKQLLIEYQNGEKTRYDCKHKNLKKRALATAVHELFHVYDFSRFSKKSSYRGCPDFQNGSNDNMSRRCDILKRQYNRSSYISGDLVFQNKAFWRKGDNQGRVADAYENKNVKEMAAVNFEYFILDKEYKCRRPTLYDYFSDKFNVKPHESFKCQSVQKVVVGQTEKSLVDIDFNRVYQVQYLLASKGDGASSKLGHSMIKLAICAPEHRDLLTNEIVPATPYGPECLNDTKFHLIASFRGNVDDMMISTAKGILGGYPSVLYMMTLDSINYEYNIEGMRDLFSFPLNFTELQKLKFLNSMMMIYWGYKGDYKLISNNCATETLNLILGAFDSVEYLAYPMSTPYGILRSLVSVGLVDKGLTENDFKELSPINKMYGNEYYLSKAYGKIFSKNDQIANRNKLVKYFEEKAEKRSEILDRIENNMGVIASRNTKRKVISILASYSLLENQALIHYMKNFRDGVLKEVIRISESSNVKVEVDRFMKSYSQVAQDYVQGGYGIPQNYELNLITEHINKMPNEEELADLYLREMEGFINNGRIEAHKIEQNILRVEKIIQNFKDKY